MPERVKEMLTKIVFYVKDYPLNVQNLDVL